MADGFFNPPSADEILTATAAVYGIQRHELTGPQAGRIPREARHVAMLFMRDALDLSYPEIARVFRRQAASTAIRGCKAATRVAREYELVRRNIRAIAALLLGRPAS